MADGAGREVSAQEALKGGGESGNDRADGISTRHMLGNARLERPAGAKLDGMSRKGGGSCVPMPVRCGVGIDWTEEEREAVEQGLRTHPMASGRCTALARIVYAVAKPRDPGARGIHLKPREAARWLVPKKSGVPYWHTHTFVETQEHSVDAVTGQDGYPARTYVADHWHFHESLDAREIDVATIDPGIQDEEQ